MAEDESHTLTFLYKIVDDNQETIRFLDTKAGFGIAVLGAIVGKVLFDQDQLTAFKSHGPMVLKHSVAFTLVDVISAFDQPSAEFFFPRRPGTEVFYL
jgi:hypothetical protein